MLTVKPPAMPKSHHRPNDDDNDSIYGMTIARAIISFCHMHAP